MLRGPRHLFMHALVVFIWIPQLVANAIGCPFHLVLLQQALLHYRPHQEVLEEWRTRVVLILQIGGKESFLEEALLVMFTSALTGENAASSCQL